MRVFLNDDSGLLINSFSFVEPVPDQVLTCKRGDSKRFDVQHGVPFDGGRELTEPLTYKFMAKVVGDNDGPAVVSNYDEDLGDFVYTKIEGDDGLFTYRLTPSWNTAKLNNLLGHDPEGFKQTTTVRCTADIAQSLHEKYFILQDRNGSVGVWFDIAGGGTAPAGALACDRQIEITTVVEDDAAGDVATALAAVLEADAEFTSSASGSLVTVEDAVIGPRDAADAGDSEFIVAEWIAGSLPNTMTNVDSVDLAGEFEITEDGVVSSSGTFTLRVDNDYVKGNEGVTSDANPAYPSPAMLMQFHVALTGLTGGGLTNLDGLTTASGQYNNRLVALKVGTELRIYQLQAGTDAEASPGIIRPDDYAASTNEKIWVSVL